MPALFDARVTCCCLDEWYEVSETETCTLGTSSCRGVLTMAPTQLWTQRSGPNSDYCVAISLVVPLGVASTRRLSLPVHPQCYITHSVTVQSFYMSLTFSNTSLCLDLLLQIQDISSSTQHWWWSTLLSRSFKTISWFHIYIYIYIYGRIELWLNNKFL